ncbi:MAG TPA: hypothetical protein VIX89_04465 [Bryobacteraceae bacterium]
MLKDGGRFCDGCGQKLPPQSMLSRQTMSKNEATELGVAALDENADGAVTVDLCLNCRVQRANRLKRGY